MDYSMIIFFSISILSVGIPMLFELLDDRKEIKLRQNDSDLQKYYGESINDRNDGWTKQHYKNLYEIRLEKLKKK